MPDTVPSTPGSGCWVGPLSSGQRLTLSRGDEVCLSIVGSLLPRTPTVNARSAAEKTTDVSEEQITAWHEAGHAFVAVYLGGEVQSLSIDPDWDDGPERHGDITVHWPRAQFSEEQLRKNAVLVALAGPVAEMIYRGDPFHPATVAEWSLDWKLAWQSADFVPDSQARMQFLEQRTIDLHRTLSQDNHWAGIGAVVDHLLAHQTLEGETVHEIIVEWL